MMIIDSFIRDENNEVQAICGGIKIHLNAEYIALNKPQIGDDIIEEPPADDIVEELVIEEPVVEELIVEEPVQEIVEQEIIEEPPVTE